MADTSPAFLDPAQARQQMDVVCNAFGPINEIADWAARPTQNNRVVRYIEHRILMAGQVYRTMTSPDTLTVIETRELIKDFEKGLVALGRIMRRGSPDLRQLFNAADGLQAERDALALAEEERVISETLLVERARDVAERDAWQALVDAIKDARERLARLKPPDGNLAELLGQPATRKKDPKRLLWEAVFTLLQECDVSPMDKYQPLIETIRAVHRLVGIDEPPNPGHLYYVVSEFQKQKAAR